MNTQSSLPRAERLTNKISIISTIFLVALLLVFMFVSIFSVKKLNEQIQLVTKHPYIITRNIGTINAQMAQMHVHTDRLGVSNTVQDIETARLELYKLQDYVEPFITEIATLYSGALQDIGQLNNVYTTLVRQQDTLLERAAEWSPSQTAEFEKTNIDPLFVRMAQTANIILDSAEKMQIGIYNSSEALYKSTLVWSMIITILCILGLILMQIYLKRAHKEIVKKNGQFETLSENIDEVFMIFDNDDNSCEYVAGNTKKVFGLSAQAIMQNRELLYDNTDPEDIPNIRSKLVDHSGIMPKEMSIKYLNPLTKKVSWLLAQFYQTLQSSVIKQIVTIEDQTDDVIAQYALQDALLNANNANNAKRDFMSRMSHEIRTPMNAIIGMTSIAAANIGDNNKVEDCLNKISFSSKHLLMLINDILDMSKIESNKLALNRESFEIYQFVNNFVAIVFSQAQLKNIEFNKKIIGFNQNAAYIGDSLRLNQILINLASNAIKFTPSGGKVSLCVERLAVHDGKDCIRFTVADTGIGMSEDALKRIFEPFEQADASIAQNYGGTGLGMSIAKNLVSLLGGYIDIKSTLGEGTCCVVEIPLDRSQTNAQSCNPTEFSNGSFDNATKQEGENLLENKTILIVEDNELNLEITAELLKMNGATVECAANGKQALDMFASSAPQYFSAILMDIQMPIMNGYDSTIAIRMLTRPDAKTIPIIAITANAFTEDMSAALSAGMNAHITKPIDIKKICEVINKLSPRK